MIGSGTAVGEQLVKPSDYCNGVLRGSRARMVRLGGAPYSGKTFVMKHVIAVLIEEIGSVNALTSLVSTGGEIGLKSKQGGPLGRALTESSVRNKHNGLFPDHLVCGVMLDALHRECLAMAGHTYSKEPRNIFLDGFPRNPVQDIFLRSLDMPWSAICFTIPKDVYIGRALEHMPKCVAEDASTIEVLDRHWRDWEEVTLPTFRKMERGHRKVVWIDGRSPLKDKVKMVIKHMGFDQKMYTYISNCLNNPQHPATTKITEAERPAPRTDLANSGKQAILSLSPTRRLGTTSWTGRHLGAIPKAGASQSEIPLHLRAAAQQASLSQRP